MARFNTAAPTLSITGAISLSYAFTPGLITLSGTSGYTVTLASPVLFPGTTQTFYNATGGNVTLTTPAGNIIGNGVTAAASQTIPNASTYGLQSDGTNYVLVDNQGGSIAVTTGSFSGNVTGSGTNAAITFSPTGTGTFTASPAGTTTLGTAGQTTSLYGNISAITSNQTVTFSPTGTGTVSVQPAGTLTLGTAGASTTITGNISAITSNQTVTLSPTGTGTVTISPAATGTMNNINIGGSTRGTAAFSTIDANNTATLSGAITATGANVAHTFSPTGTGTVTISPAGATTLGTAGVTTNLYGNISAATSNQTVSLNPSGTGSVTISPTGSGGLTISPSTTGSINNVNIGASTRGTAAFTTLAANGTVSLTAATDATSSSAGGTLTVTGGAAISAKLYVGTSINSVSQNLTPATLTTALGDIQTFNTISGNNGNSSVFTMSHFRTSAGADWTTSATRFQQKIDTTHMAWMQFNGTNANGGISWGTGQSTANPQSVPEVMRLDSSGRLNLLANVASSSTSTGTIIVTGGIGVSGSVYLGGTVSAATGTFTNGTVTTAPSGANDIANKTYVDLKPSAAFAYFCAAI